MKKQILLICVLTALTGCSLSGTDEFSCADPEKGICLPADEAYVHAESNRDAKSVTASRKESSSQEEAVMQNSKYSNVAPVNGLMTLPISQPKPILESAKVVKVWVNSWEDEAKVLHMPQEAYVEVTPRRWNIKDSSVRSFKSSSPFKKVF
jgi:type IV conjugative transfer system lipoprotein TraV